MRNGTRNGARGGNGAVKRHLAEQTWCRNLVTDEIDAVAAVNGRPVVPSRTRRVERTGSPVGNRVTLPPEAVPPAGEAGGGRVFTARRPVYGAAAAVRLFAGLRRLYPDAVGHPATVNGSRGWVAERAGSVMGVVVLMLLGGWVTAVDVVVNPEKLRGVRPPSGSAWRTWEGDARG